jgi:hypothetical protein
MRFSPRTTRKLKQNVTRDKAETLLAALQRAKSTSARTATRIPYASLDDAALVQSALDRAIASTQRTIARLNLTLEPIAQAPELSASIASRPPQSSAESFTPLMPRSDQQTA